LFTDLTDIYEEPLMYIYQYLSEIIFLDKNVSDMFTSRLALKIFMETYMVKNLDLALSLRIEKETYNIPKVESFDNFKDVFQEGILPLPSIDNLKIMGFRNNEEIIGNYTRSKDSFRLLTNYFYETRTEDLDEKLLNKSQTTEFQTLLKKSPRDLADLGLTSYLEYSLSIIEKYEDMVGFSTDSVKIIIEIAEAFNPKIFEQIGQSLNLMSPAQGLDSNTPGRSSKANLPSYILKASDLEQSVKSTDKHQTSIRDKTEKEDSHSLNSFENKKTKVAAFKVKFSRSYLLLEFKAILKIADWITRDLSIAKMYLCGEPIFRLDHIASPILKSFYLNEVPNVWKERLYSKNVNFENFTLLLKSLLMKLDQLFSLTVKLKGDLPPIIPIDRLLDPESFFINLWHAHCKLRMISYPSCVFTLRSCKVKDYTESSSTIKISGLCVRGGCIDPITGELVDESPREFSSPLSSMFLDVVEAESFDIFSDQEPNHATFVMLNPSGSNAKNMRKEFFKEMAKEVNNPSTLAFDKNSSKNSPVQMKRDMNMRFRKQLTMEIQSDTIKYCVRIPIYFSSSEQPQSLAKIDFYLYCYSALPQIHWINRGSFVKLMDNQNN
jgi:hypothetical protein